MAGQQMLLERQVEGAIDTEDTMMVDNRTRGDVLREAAAAVAATQALLRNNPTRDDGDPDEDAAVAIEDAEDAARHLYKDASYDQAGLTRLARNMAAQRAPTTIRKYDSNMNLFQDFCTKNNYDPAKIVDVGARFWEWLFKVQKELQARGEKCMAHSSVRGFHSALNAEYLKTHVSTGKVLDLLEHRHYKDAYTALCKYIQNLEKPAARDPQASSVFETMTHDDYKKCVRAAWDSDAKDSPQVRFEMCAMWQGFLRSDDARCIRICEIGAPYIMAVGPAETKAFEIMIQGSKTAKDGIPEYITLIRNEDLDICPINALAEFILHRFTLSGEKFPMPVTDWDHYLAVYLCTGADPRKAVTYPTQAARVKKYLKACSATFRKVLHAFRAGAARWLDVLGVAAEIIARMGRWDLRHSVMLTNYIAQSPIAGVLAAAGFLFKEPKESVWSERFFVGVDKDLVHILFPWLKQFQDEAKRVPKENGVGPCNVALAMYELACVLLQDCVHRAAMGQSSASVEMLARDPRFKAAVQKHQELMATKAYDALRAKSLKDIVAGAVKQALQESGIAAAGPAVPTAPVQPAVAAPPVLDGPPVVEQEPQDTAQPALPAGYPIGNTAVFTNIKTLPERLSALETGFNGGLAFKDLEDRYGSRWRSGGSTKDKANMRRAWSEFNTSLMPVFNLARARKLAPQAAAELLQSFMMSNSRLNTMPKWVNEVRASKKMTDAIAQGHVDGPTPGTREKPKRKATACTGSKKTRRILNMEAAAEPTPVETAVAPTPLQPAAAAGMALPGMRADGFTAAAVAPVRLPFATAASPGMASPSAAMAAHLVAGPSPVRSPQAVAALALAARSPQAAALAARSPQAAALAARSPQAVAALALAARSPVAVATTGDTGSPGVPAAMTQAQMQAALTRLAQQQQQQLLATLLPQRLQAHSPANQPTAQALHGAVMQQALRLLLVSRMQANQPAAPPLPMAMPLPAAVPLPVNVPPPAAVPTPVAVAGPPFQPTKQWHAKMYFAAAVYDQEHPDGPQGKLKLTACNKAWDGHKAARDEVWERCERLAKSVNAGEVQEPKSKRDIRRGL